MPNWCVNRILINNKERKIKSDDFVKKNNISKGEDFFDVTKIIYGYYLVGGYNDKAIKAITSFIEDFTHTKITKDKPVTTETIKDVANKLFTDLSQVVFKGAEYELSDAYISCLARDINKYVENNDHADEILDESESDLYVMGKMYFIANIATGFTDWYEFNCTNYGTKWIPRFISKTESEDIVDFIVDSAWTPITPVITEMSKRYGLSIYFAYAEPGMEIIGEQIIENGDVVCESSYATDDLEYGILTNSTSGFITYRVENGKLVSEYDIEYDDFEKLELLPEKTDLEEQWLESIKKK